MRFLSPSRPASSLLPWSLHRSSDSHQNLSSSSAAPCLFFSRTFLHRSSSSQVLPRTDLAGRSHPLSLWDLLMVRANQHASRNKLRATLTSSIDFEQPGIDLGSERCVCTSLPFQDLSVPFQDLSAGPPQRTSGTAGRHSSPFVSDDLTVSG